MKETLLWIWQLPQHIIALLLRWVITWEEMTETDNARVYYSEKAPGSVSLGQYIFLKRNDVWDRKHEEGHTRQSMWLGPLYLLVIGLPSFIWCCLCRIRMRYRDMDTAEYYRFYTESWANRIAGIKVEDME